MSFIRSSVIACALLTLTIGPAVPASAAASARLPASAGAAPSLSSLPRAYRTIDLGTLGGSESYAWAINNRGQVVGGSEIPNGTVHPFLWQHGKMTDISGPGWGGNYRARAINDRGQVVGSGDVTNPSEYLHHAFLWQNGKTTDLGTLGGPISSAEGINDRGQIVGISLTPKDGWHAFLWQNGQMTDIGDFDAGPINDLGQVVGSDLHLNLGQGPASRDAGGYAVRWWRGRLIHLGTGTLGATGINEKGSILVSTDDDHVLLWRHGRTTDIGSLGSGTTAASGLNDLDQVVGRSAPGGPQPRFERPFLWQRGVMTDLTMRGLAKESVVFDINDLGLIVGYMSYKNTVHAALFLR